MHVGQSGSLPNDCSFSHNFGGLQIYYQNVRGLKSKTRELFLASLTCDPDVICLTETWLDSSVTDTELFCDRFSVFRTDRNFDLIRLTRGGGVLIAINNNLRVFPLDIRSSVPNVDVVGIRVAQDKVSLYVIVLYIPPALTHSDYESIFEDLLKVDSITENDELIVLGDFNITDYVGYFRNRDAPSPVIVLLSNFSEFFKLYQYNDILNVNDRILDLVFSTSEARVIKSSNYLLPEDLHHPPLEIFLSSPVPSKKFRVNRRLSYNFKRSNFQRLYADLLSADFSEVTSCPDSNHACDIFYRILDSVFASSVPKTFMRSRYYPPWFSSALIHDIKTKSRHWRNYKKTGNLIEYRQFVFLRAKIKQDLSVAYAQYISRIENQINLNPNQFWSFLNAKRNSTSIPNSMTHNNILLTDPQDIVEAFADFFQQSYTSSRLSSSSSESYSALSSLPTPILDENSVLEALKRSKNKYTSGYDAIPSFILRDCACVFAGPLTHIFNMSLQASTFPDIWKLSRICPVFKKNDKSAVENYRPIAILCNFGKIFENILYDVIFNHVKCLLTHQQHGFFPGRSTTTNLLCVTQFIAEELDAGGQVDVIYTDLSKAFDRLDHTILLRKLSYFGLSSGFVSFFESYFSNRHLSVSYRGFQSSSIIAWSGVPQGSVLGPLLFNLYINDVVGGLQSKTLLYADDLKLYASIKTVDDCLTLQRDLNNLWSWCSNNNLELNISKCVHVPFTRKKSAFIYNYSINDMPLSRQDKFRDLGVLFDTGLSFVDHINDIANTSFRNLGFILRNCKDFSERTLKTLFNVLVRSKLEYASVVWSPNYAVHQATIERPQRRFLKYLWFRSQGSYPVAGFPHEELLAAFSVDDLESRRRYFSLVFLFKLLNGTMDCPDILSCLHFNVPDIRTRSNAYSFYLPTVRTNLLKFSPTYMMCNIYHTIQSDIDIFSTSIREIKAIVLTSIT